MRECFVNQRLPRLPVDGVLKDLTQFFHNGQADILLCAGCALLVRKEYEAPPSETYSDESYDPASVERVYPRYLRAFHAKEEPYRKLLAPGARVLEIGSHYGAFLQTAQEWGWHAEGVDIGKDTSRFVRSKGFFVHTQEIRDCGFDGGSFDGVFIWNCFEQIAAPKPVLLESRRILEPGGLLALRTPNGLFYRLCESLLANEGLERDKADFLKEAMAYNNLLGFHIYMDTARLLWRGSPNPAVFVSKARGTPNC